MDFKSSLEFLRNKYSKQLSNQHTNTPTHIILLNFYTPLIVRSDSSEFSFYLLYLQPMNPDLEYRDVMFWGVVLLRCWIKIHKQTIFSWLTITGIWSASRLGMSLWVWVPFQVFLMKLEMFAKAWSVRGRASKLQYYTTWWYLKKQLLAKRAIVNSSWLSFLLTHSPDHTLYHYQMERKTKQFFQHFPFPRKTWFFLG